MKYTWDILIDTYFYMKVSAYVEEFLKSLSYLERIALLKIVRAVCHGFNRTIHLDPPANAQAVGGAFKKIMGLVGNWEVQGVTRPKILTIPILVICKKISMSINS